MANISELASKLVSFSKDLGDFHNSAEVDIATDNRLKWAFRYGTLSCIQLAFDLACAIIARRNLGMPHSYKECIRLLSVNGFIDSELTEFLKNCVPIRERLLHDFNGETDEDAYEIMLNSHLFIKYSESVTSFEK
jgi:uncharacterized protein YutE (UPF0331/DUF86 family)